MAKRKNIDSISLDESRQMIGTDLPFAAVEAYKLLRTNLSFSLRDNSGCKVIGVTSALRGEGKSTTSINMAYSMAQTSQKVLLVEADLRLPNIASRLGIRKRPGLSNLLAGQCNGRDVLQSSGFMDNLRVITAGDIPPNAAELLGSVQMSTAIRILSEGFDVIIIDLPPVNVVSDALALAKIVSGMVVVVRQDYCDRAALNNVVRQLRFAETRILGFVMTGSDMQKKNYKRYGEGYGYDSQATKRKAKKKND